MGKTIRDLDPKDEKGALDAIQSEFAPDLSLLDILADREI